MSLIKFAYHHRPSGTAPLMLSAALPAMAAGLGVTDTAIQWIATAYLMALAAGVPLSAWAARRFGATQLWL